MYNDFVKNFDPNVSERTQEYFKKFVLSDKNTSINENFKEWLKLLESDPDTATELYRHLLKYLKQFPQDEVANILFKAYVSKLLNPLVKDFYHVPSDFSTEIDSKVKSNIEQFMQMKQQKPFEAKLLYDHFKHFSTENEAFLLYCDAYDGKLPEHFYNGYAMPSNITDKPGEKSLDDYLDSQLNNRQKHMINEQQPTSNINAANMSDQEMDQLIVTNQDEHQNLNRQTSDHYNTDDDPRIYEGSEHFTNLFQTYDDNDDHDNADMNNIILPQDGDMTKQRIVNSAFQLSISFDNEQIDMNEVLDLVKQGITKEYGVDAIKSSICDVTINNNKSFKIIFDHNATPYCINPLDNQSSYYTELRTGKLNDNTLATNRGQLLSVNKMPNADEEIAKYDGIYQTQRQQFNDEFPIYKPYLHYSNAVNYSDDAPMAFDADNINNMDIGEKMELSNYVTVDKYQEENAVTQQNSDFINDDNMTKNDDDLAINNIVVTPDQSPQNIQRQKIDSLFLYKDHANHKGEFIVHENVKRARLRKDFSQHDSATQQKVIDAFDEAEQLAIRCAQQELAKKGRSHTTKDLENKAADYLPLALKYIACKKNFNPKELAAFKTFTKLSAKAYAVSLKHPNGKTEALAGQSRSRILRIAKKKIGVWKIFSWISLKRFLNRQNYQQYLSDKEKFFPSKKSAEELEPVDIAEKEIPSPKQTKTDDLSENDHLLSKNANASFENNDDKEKEKIASQQEGKGYDDDENQTSFDH